MKKGICVCACNGGMWLQNQLGWAPCSQGTGRTGLPGVLGTSAALCSFSPLPQHPIPSLF